MKFIDMTKLCLLQDRYKLNSMIKSKQDPSKIQTLIENSTKAAKSRELHKKIVLNENLPVTCLNQELEDCIKNNQVIIVVGETGSGKSTQLPKILLNLGLGTYASIAHTQPRRLAVLSIAKRLSEEIGSNLGDLVGYKIRFYNKVSDKTLVKVMTDGVLLNEIYSDPLLLKYSAIIIDEAHERGINSDLLLGYLKSILLKRPDLKIIVTSATINHKLFIEFFPKSFLINIPGRCFPVEIIYESLLEQKQSWYDRIILKIGYSIDYTDGNVLVFLPGEYDIKQLEKKLQPIYSQYLILPLYAKLNIHRQNLIFKDGNQRKIILATNIAETSITAPNITAVVDTGKARVSLYSYKLKIQQLPIRTITKANLSQRAGRAGRTRSGICFRLITEDEFNDLEEYPKPEILRINLANVVLKMYLLKLKNIQDFPFITRPPNKAFNDAYNLLKMLGALDRNLEITSIGRQMAYLPYDPRFSRILVAAKSSSQLYETIIIISGLIAGDPRNLSEKSYIEFTDHNSEFIELINLYKYWLEVKKLSSSARKKKLIDMKLNIVKFLEWQNLAQEMCSYLKYENEKYIWDINFNIIHNNLATGFIDHVMQLSPDKSYYTTVRNLKIPIKKIKKKQKSQPQHLIAAYIIETEQINAFTKAQILPEQLIGAAPHLEQIKYSDPYFCSKTGYVKCEESILLFGIILKSRQCIAKQDPEKIRKIFIQEALVNRKINIKANFITHNYALLDELHDLEIKSQKQLFDLDDNKILNFYLSRLPDWIISVQHLKEFLKSHSDKNLIIDRKTFQEKINFLTELLPNTICIRGIELDLEYKYNLNKSIIAIYIIIPDILESLFEDKDFAWFIPYFLTDRVHALVKTLPKDIRIKLQPINKSLTTITKHLEHEHKKNSDFWSSLVAVVNKITNSNISKHDFDESRILDNLKFQYKIKGRIKTTCNCNELNSSESELIQNIEITNWSWDEFPWTTKLYFQDIVVDAKSQLLITQEKCFLTKQAKLKFNKQDHITGLAILLFNENSKMSELFLKNMKNCIAPKLSLWLSKFNKDFELTKSLFLASITHYLNKQTLPNTRAQWLEIVSNFKNDYLQKIINYLEELQPIIMRIENTLKNQSNAHMFSNEYLKDLESDYKLLTMNNFWLNIPLENFYSLKNYYSTIARRLEKHNLEKLYPEYYSTYKALIAKFNIIPADIKWELQELKLNIFNSSIRNIRPISVKKIWKKYDLKNNKELF